jgi:hypothetical protein
VLSRPLPVARFPVTALLMLFPMPKAGRDLLYRSAQLETLYNSFNYLLQEMHALGQQKSELYLLLASHRTFG